MTVSNNGLHFFYRTLEFTAESFSELNERDFQDAKRLTKEEASRIDDADKIRLRREHDYDTGKEYFTIGVTDERRFHAARIRQRQQCLFHLSAALEFFVEVGVLAVVRAPFVNRFSQWTYLIDVVASVEGKEDEDHLISLLSHLDDFVICDSVHASFSDIQERVIQPADGIDDPSDMQDRCIKLKGFLPKPLVEMIDRHAPAAEESADEWLSRMLIQSDRLEVLNQQVVLHKSVTGHFLQQARSSGIIGHERDALETKWIVPGMLPSQTLGLFAGERKKGKSALMLQLALCAATGDEWIGFPLEKQEGFVIYVSGEDGVSRTIERAELMCGGKRLPSNLWITSPSTPEELVDLIGYILNNELNVSLMIIDPTLKYFLGDEKSPQAVNAFYDPLERLISETGSAVIVTHHVLKNKHPQTINEAFEVIRGSGVLSDRPRVIFTLARSRSGKIQFGIPVSNGDAQHNGLPGEYYVEPITLFRDSANTMLHFRADSSKPKRSAETETLQQELNAIVNAVERINAEGGKVTRTGTNGLFEQSPEEIDGMSRAKVRMLVNKLVEDAVLFNLNGTIMTEQGLAA